MKYRPEHLRLACWRFANGKVRIKIIHCSCHGAFQNFNVPTQEDSDLIRVGRNGADSMPLEV